MLKALKLTTIQKVNAMLMTAISSGEDEPFNDFVESLSKDEQAELLALMWSGRDGKAMECHLDHAQTEVDGTVGMYIVSKGQNSLTYIKQGLALLKRTGA